jgi:hypothetical protein
MKKSIVCMGHRTRRRSGNAFDQKDFSKSTKKRPRMTIKIHKGYEIEATAEQDDNAEWSVG